MTTPGRRQVVVRPLTAPGFAPFGEVLELNTAARRSEVRMAFDRGDVANQPRLWVSTFQRASALPLSMTVLERHPHSAQTVVPLGTSGYFVVACLADRDGKPDLDTLCAFQARSDQAVTYGRNVWHHGMCVKEAPARFLVCMSVADEGGDDVFETLSASVEVVAVDACDPAAEGSR